MDGGKIFPAGGKWTKCPNDAGKSDDLFSILSSKTTQAASGFWMLRVAKSLQKRILNLSGLSHVLTETNYFNIHALHFRAYLNFYDFTVLTWISMVQLVKNTQLTFVI